MAENSMKTNHRTEDSLAKRDSKPKRRPPAGGFRSAVGTMVKLPPLAKRVDTLGRKVIQRRQRRGGDFGPAI
jgi:hypothetical protein